MYRITVTTSFGLFHNGIEEYTGPVFPTIYSIGPWQEESVRPCGEYPANPNLGIISGVADQATLDAIEADPNYTVLSSDLIEEGI